MSVSRRKFLRIASTLGAGISGLFVARRALPSPTTERDALGYKLHDDVSVSLLNTYARSLALKDERARWRAQMMFHKAQLARDQGGTEGHKLGYHHAAFVDARERDLPPANNER